MIILAATKALDSVGFLEGLGAIIVVATVLGIIGKIFYEIAENRAEIRKIVRLQERISKLENEVTKLNYESDSLSKLLAIKHRSIDGRFTNIEAFLAVKLSYNHRQAESDSGADFL